MRSQGIVIVVIGALLGATAAPGSARAWDSICYRFKDPSVKGSELTLDDAVIPSRGCQGIDAAHGRWRDVKFKLDEHRRLFELAAIAAGLPESVLATQRLAVLTDHPSVLVTGGSKPPVKYSSVKPRTLLTAHGAAFRWFALDEFAQLPDFSFALWDWANGNETCPIPSMPAKFGSAQQCHTFESHMGALNSHHFPPQSDKWAAYYHGLAMTRAVQCRTQRASIWNAEPADRREATDARLAGFFRACEVETLAYEAIGQHYLQDSWSAGHMWQRWGSTSLESYPYDWQVVGEDTEDKEWNDHPPELRKLVVAEIAAVSAGTIHGSDVPLFEKYNATTHDAMCFPSDGVEAVAGDVVFPVVGDLHLHDVTGGPPEHGDIAWGPLPYDVTLLGEQRDRLLGCAAGSLGAVYAELADASSYQAPVLGAASAAPPFDAAGCLAPKATNQAMLAGIEPYNIAPVIGEANAAVVSIPDEIEAWARNDYDKLRHAALLVADLKSTGTEISSLHLDQFIYQNQSCDKYQGCAIVPHLAAPALFTMVGVKPNRCYVEGSHEGCGMVPPGGGELATFIDPLIPEQLPPPDPTDPPTEPKDLGGVLALAFHMSRAPDLCDTVTAEQLAALPTVVGGVDIGDDHVAACQACAEWTAPFLRVGKDADDYDTTAEPLCHFASASPEEVPYVYEPAVGTVDPLALARRHCGCRGLVAVTNAGLTRLDVVATPDATTLTQMGATVPLIGAQETSIPREVAAASQERLLVSLSNGDIVGVREDAVVDLDGNADNGKTRLTLGGNLQGIAVVNVAAKELLLAVTSDTGELIVWDLGAHVQCERFSVAEVEGQGAYDVVVSADLSQVWISLRKGVPLSGALASVSLPALAQCDGTAQATLDWLAPPGSPSGLGPMALSPDGSRLAVGGRLVTTCPDQVRNPMGNPIDIEVGCDRVYVLDVDANAWLQFDGGLSVPTRPGRYPYGVAWFGDSVRLAFASFQGVDVNGLGDSGWPMNMGDKVPIGGTLRLADTAGANYQGGGNNMSRHWTYNTPLDGQVIGPTVVVDGGADGDPGTVFVGTLTGRVSAYAVAPHVAEPDPMWEGANADPETSLHVSTSGAWYGGCSHACGPFLGYTCASVCPNDSVPGGFGSIELGAGVRVLASY